MERTRELIIVPCRPQYPPVTARSLCRLFRRRAPGGRCRKSKAVSETRRLLNQEEPSPGSFLADSRIPLVVRNCGESLRHSHRTEEPEKNTNLLPELLLLLDVLLVLLPCFEEERKEKHGAEDGDA